MINRVFLVGRVGRDPESRIVGRSSVSAFSLATNERWTDNDGAKQERTEWHNIIAWNKLGEFAAKYITKGKLLGIEGRIRYRDYETKDGEKRYVTEIIASNIQILSTREDLAF